MRKLTARAHGVDLPMTELSSLFSKPLNIEGSIPLARRASVALKLAGSKAGWANACPAANALNETSDWARMLDEVGTCSVTRRNLTNRPGERGLAVGPAGTIICRTCKDGVLSELLASHE